MRCRASGMGFQWHTASSTRPKLGVACEALGLLRGPGLGRELVSFVKDDQAPAAGTQHERLVSRRLTLLPRPIELERVQRCDHKVVVIEGQRALERWPSRLQAKR